MHTSITSAIHAMLEKASFLTASDKEKWVVVLCPQLT